MTEVARPFVNVALRAFIGWSFVRARLDRTLPPIHFRGARFAFSGSYTAGGWPIYVETRRV